MTYVFILFSLNSTGPSIHGIFRCRIIKKFSHNLPAFSYIKTRVQNKFFSFDVTKVYLSRREQKTSFIDHFVKSDLQLLKAQACGLQASFLCFVPVLRPGKDRCVTRLSRLLSRMLQKPPMLPPNQPLPSPVSRAICQGPPGERKQETLREKTNSV